MDVKRAVAAVVGVIVAMSLFPMIVYYTTPANVNATGTAATLLPLVQVFYIIGVMVTVILSLLPEEYFKAND